MTRLRGVAWCRMLAVSTKRERLSIAFARPEALEYTAPEVPGPEELDHRLEQTIRWWRKWTKQITVHGSQRPGVVRSAITLKGLTFAPTGAMASAVIEGEVAALNKAIAAKDRKQFAAGFDKLTAACNACHQSAKHAFIVVQRPTGNPYTNQAFAPVRSSETMSHKH